MEITVALDGEKKRDLRFFAGDDMSLTIVVYEHDGDITPITVSNVRFAAADGSLPMDSEFVVPSNFFGRVPYRIVGEVEDITTTLAYGVMQTAGGWPSLFCWCSGPGPYGIVGKSDNITVLDAHQNFDGIVSVEGALQQLGDFKKSAGDFDEKVEIATEAAASASASAADAAATLEGSVKKLSTGTEYLSPGTTSLTPRSLTAGQSIRGDGAAQTILNIPGGTTGITGANLAELARIQLNGDGKTVGTPGTVGVYSEAWNGKIEQVTAQNINGTAFRAKGGWNTHYSNIRVTQCKIGMEFIEYTEVLPGWAGSGHLIGPAFITFCDTGIDIGKLWNPTLINVVLEYCDVPAKFSGTHQVIINPWFEGNTNTPLWTRGAVLMGGRGVTFQSTLDADLPGVSAGAAQEEAITWLDEQGISVFRDPAQRMFYATGRKGVQALRHFGVEGLTELSVQGRHFMPTAVTADFSSLRGYGAREGTFVTPADQYSANHETSAVVNRGTRSGDVISGAVVIRTGTKGAVPGDSTSADRWQFNASGHLVPFANITYDIGTSALRSRAVYSDSFRLGTTQGVFGGTASPEASITANPGSIYMRNDSTGGNTVWMKSSGTGNTGWIRMQGIRTGTTAQRPSDADTGTMYLDTTLSKPIWKLGANWIDATGTTV